MEAVNGSNTAERPMWAEKGGLDFEGRAKWDAWTAVKGLRPDKAKLEFVKVHRLSTDSVLRFGTAAFADRCMFHCGSIPKFKDVVPAVPAGSLLSNGLMYLHCFPDVLRVFAADHVPGP